MKYIPGQNPYFDNMLELRKKKYTYQEIADLTGGKKDNIYQMFKTRGMIIGKTYKKRNGSKPKTFWQKIREWMPW